MLKKFVVIRSNVQLAVFVLAVIIVFTFIVELLPTQAHAQSCPWHCRVWLSDGCNTCSCNNGRIEDCTKAGCPYPTAPGRCIDPHTAVLDHVRTCRWFGTAPFCSGSCPPGYHQKMRDRRGDGKKCVSGSKVYCCAERRVSQPVSFCRSYAETAIAQHRQALDRGCSVSGPEWSQNFYHHINWCLTLANVQLAVAGQQARAQFLQTQCPRG